MSPRPLHLFHFGGAAAQVRARASSGVAGSVLTASARRWLSAAAGGQAAAPEGGAVAWIGTTPPPGRAHAMGSQGDAPWLVTTSGVTPKCWNPRKGYVPPAVHAALDLVAREQRAALAVKATRTAARNSNSARYTPLAPPHDDADAVAPLRGEQRLERLISLMACGPLSGRGAGTPPAWRAVP